MDEFDLHLPRKVQDTPTWDDLVTRGGREEYTKAAKKRKRRGKVPTDHHRPE